MLSPVTTAQRTSIPLRSILNVDDGHDSTEKLQPTTPPPESKAVVVEKTVAQHSQFLFINTHNRAARHGLLKFGFEPVWEDLEEAEYVYWLWGREA